MRNCEKCGAYIPIGETACPACGYDPEAEARAAREAEERRQAEERSRQAAAQAREQAQREEEARQKARAEEAERRRAAEERRRAEEARRREAEQRRWQQDPRQQQGFTGGAAQSQYASDRTDGPGRTQYTSERTGSQTAWAPPWQETRDHGGARQRQSQTSYEDARRQAADSVSNQKLSILSYIGPLFVIPLFLRKDDSFARFHANQGLSLFLATAAVSTVASALGIELLGAAASLFSLYGMVTGIRNVIRGRREPLPLIGNWKLIK